MLFFSLDDLTSLQVMLTFLLAVAGAIFLALQLKRLIKMILTINKDKHQWINVVSAAFLIINSIVWPVSPVWADSPSRATQLPPPQPPTTRPATNPEPSSPVANPLRAQSNPDSAVTQQALTRVSGTSQAVTATTRPGALSPPVPSPQQLNPSGGRITTSDFINPNGTYQLTGSNTAWVSDGSGNRTITAANGVINGTSPTRSDFYNANTGEYQLTGSNTASISDGSGNRIITANGIIEGTSPTRSDFYNANTGEYQLTGSNTASSNGMTVSSNGALTPQNQIIRAGTGRTNPLSQSLPPPQTGATDPSRLAPDQIMNWNMTDYFRATAFLRTDAQGTYRIEASVVPARRGAVRSASLSLTDQTNPGNTFSPVGLIQQSNGTFDISSSTPRLMAGHRYTVRLSVVLSDGRTQLNTTYVTVPPQTGSQPQSQTSSRETTTSSSRNIQLTNNRFLILGADGVFDLNEGNKKTGKRGTNPDSNRIRAGQPGWELVGVRQSDNAPIYWQPVTSSDISPTTGTGPTDDGSSERIRLAELTRQTVLERQLQERDAMKRAHLQRLQQSAPYTPQRRQEEDLQRQEWNQLLSKQQEERQLADRRFRLETSQEPSSGTNTPPTQTQNDIPPSRPQPGRQYQLVGQKNVRVSFSQRYNLYVLEEKNPNWRRGDREEDEWKTVGILPSLKSPDVEGFPSLGRGDNITGYVYRCTNCTSTGNSNLFYVKITKSPVTAGANPPAPPIRPTPPEINPPQSPPNSLSSGATRYTHPDGTTVEVNWMNKTAVVTRRDGTQSRYENVKLYFEVSRPPADSREVVLACQGTYSPCPAVGTLASSVNLASRGGGTITGIPVSSSGSNPSTPPTTTQPTPPPTTGGIVSRPGPNDRQPDPQPAPSSTQRFFATPQEAILDHVRSNPEFSALAGINLGSIRLEGTMKHLEILLEGKYGLTQITAQIGNDKYLATFKYDLATKEYSIHTFRRQGSSPASAPPVQPNQPQPRTSGIVPEGNPQTAERPVAACTVTSGMVSGANQNGGCRSLNGGSVEFLYPGEELVEVPAGTYSREAVARILGLRPDQILKYYHIGRGLDGNYVAATSAMPGGLVPPTSTGLNGLTPPPVTSNPNSKISTPKLPPPPLAPPSVPPAMQNGLRADYTLREERGNLLRRGSGNSYQYSIDGQNYEIKVFPSGADFQIPGGYTFLGISQSLETIFGKLINAAPPVSGGLVQPAPARGSLVPPTPPREPIQRNNSASSPLDLSLPGGVNVHYSSQDPNQVDDIRFTGGRFNSMSFLQEAQYANLDTVNAMANEITTAVRNSGFSGSRIREIPNFVNGIVSEVTASMNASTAPNTNTFNDNMRPRIPPVITVNEIDEELQAGSGSDLYGFQDNQGNVDDIRVAKVRYKNGSETLQYVLFKNNTVFSLLDSFDIGGEPGSTWVGGKPSKYIGMTDNGKAVSGNFAPEKLQDVQGITFADGSEWRPTV